MKSKACVAHQRSHRSQGPGLQRVTLLVSRECGAIGTILIRVGCAVTQNHYAISGLRSTEGRVCIHGPAATRVCLDVYGICYHKGGITTKRPMNAEGHAKLAPLLAGPGKAGTPLHWALPQELTPALWRDSPPLTMSRRNRPVRMNRVELTLPFTRGRWPQGPRLNMNSTAITQAHIQGLGLAHHKIYPIYILLERMKGPDPWNDICRIFMTWSR